jgi:hypothetical protein
MGRDCCSVNVKFLKGVVRSAVWGKRNSVEVAEAAAPPIFTYFNFRILTPSRPTCFFDVLKMNLITYP